MVWDLETLDRLNEAEIERQRQERQEKEAAFEAAVAEEVNRRLAQKEAKEKSEN